jgi:hypothetical protein
MSSDRFIVVQVGLTRKAKRFLKRLNNQLKGWSAPLDPVGYITAKEAEGLSPSQLFEAALDAE